jgi:hypothetical protein
MATYLSFELDLPSRLRNLWVLILLCFCLLGGFYLSLVKPAAAQDAPSPPSQLPGTDPQNPKAAAQQPPATPSLEAKPEEKSEEKKADEKGEHHRSAFVVAPLPIVSPAIGSGIVPVAGYIFPFQAKDKASPPSVVGAAGFITDNGSRGFGLGGDLYLKEALYELKSITCTATWTTTFTALVTPMRTQGSNYPWNRPARCFSSNSCVISAGSFTWAGASSPEALS